MLNSKQRATLKSVASRTDAIFQIGKGGLNDAAVKSIGDALGKRDHSTIMHGIEKVDNDIKQYEDIRRTIDVLKNKINPSD